MAPRPLSRHHIERRPKHVVARERVGAALEEELGDVEVALEDRAEQRRLPERVDRIDTRAAVEEL